MWTAAPGLQDDNGQKLESDKKHKTEQESYKVNDINECIIYNCENHVTDDVMRHVIRPDSAREEDDDRVLAESRWFLEERKDWRTVSNGEK